MISKDPAERLAFSEWWKAKEGTIFFHDDSFYAGVEWQKQRVAAPPAPWSEYEVRRDALKAAIAEFEAYLREVAE